MLTVDAPNRSIDNGTLFAEQKYLSFGTKAMRSQHKKLTFVDNIILSDWGYFAAAAIALLLIDFFILPILLNTKAAQLLTLPIIQTICQYSALFFGIVALVKIINACFFKSEQPATDNKQLDL